LSVPGCGYFISVLSDIIRMARKGILGAVIGAAVVGVAYRGLKKKKKTEAPADPGKLQDAEVISAQRTPAVAARTCPGCGNTDTSGSERCPVCYTVLDPGSRPEDI
jgi:hypothetical protein